MGIDAKSAKASLVAYENLLLRKTNRRARRPQAAHGIDRGPHQRVVGEELPAALQSELLGFRIAVRPDKARVHHEEVSIGGTALGDLA